MKTFESAGAALEFDDRGQGDPLVLVHGSVFADPWEPMLGYGDLLANHRVVTYRRRGYGGSSPAPPSHSLRDEGADLVALLDHLGIALSDVPALFGLDLPAGRRWVLDEDAARSLDHPTLLVMGSDTGPIYRETNEALTALLSDVEHRDVTDAGHFVHVEQPEQVAVALAAFLERAGEV